MCGMMTGGGGFCVFSCEARMVSIKFIGVVFRGKMKEQGGK